MLSLRTIWGLDSDYIKNNFGLEFLIHFEENIKKQNAEFIIKNKGNYKLSNKGKLYADKIASDCFV